MNNICNKTVCIPTLLYDMYTKQVQELGFTNKSEVLTYLIEALYRKDNGLKNSSVVRKILQYVPIERNPILWRMPKTITGFSFTGETVMKLSSVHSGRKDILPSLIEAFLGVHPNVRKRLRIEIHAKLLQNISTINLRAQVSEKQYETLKGIAVRAGLSISALLNLCIDILIISEGMGNDNYIPEEIQDAFSKYLRIEGVTTWMFKQDCYLNINVRDDLKCMKIIALMKKYIIPTDNEFLRRIVLFLLHAKDISFEYKASADDSYKAETDEYEDYYNEQLARKSFIKELYHA